MGRFQGKVSNEAKSLSKIDHYQKLMSLVPLTPVMGSHSTDLSEFTRQKDEELESVYSNSFFAQLAPRS